MPEQLICNFDNSVERAFVLREIGGLRGHWRIELIRYRPRRSDLQNRYWWGVVVKMFFDFLKAQDVDISHPEQVHDLLKQKFLICDVTNAKTGEVIGQRVRSTTELTTEEFSDLLERAKAWLADMFHIYVPDPAEIKIPTEMQMR